MIQPCQLGSWCCCLEMFFFFLSYCLLLGPHLLGSHILHVFIPDFSQQLLLSLAPRGEGAMPLRKSHYGQGKAIGAVSPIQKNSLLSPSSRYQCFLPRDQNSPQTPSPDCGLGCEPRTREIPRGCRECRYTSHPCSGGQWERPQELAWRPFVSVVVPQWGRCSEDTIGFSVHKQQSDSTMKEKLQEKRNGLDSQCLYGCFLSAFFQIRGPANYVAVSDRHGAVFSNHLPYTAPACFHCVTPYLPQISAI